MWFKVQTVLLGFDQAVRIDQDTQGSRTTPRANSSRAVARSSANCVASVGKRGGSAASNGGSSVSFFPVGRRAEFGHGLIVPREHETLAPIGDMVHVLREMTGDFGHHRSLCHERALHRTSDGHIVGFISLFPLPHPTPCGSGRAPGSTRLILAFTCCAPGAAANHA